MLCTLLASLPMAMAFANHEAKITETSDSVILSNGLVSRRILKGTCVATVSFMRSDSGHEFIRSVEPEARLVLSGEEVWLGGAQKVPNRGFLTDAWIGSLKPDPRSIPLVGVRMASCEAEVPHKDKSGRRWSPKGKAVILEFAGKGVRADVRYEIYDGLATVGKRVTLRNERNSPLVVDHVSTERLAVVEGESVVEQPKTWRLPNLTVYTSMSFGGKFDTAVHWKEDPEFGTQVNYELKTPCLLDVHPPIGPGVTLTPNGEYRSIKSYVVLHGNGNREAVSHDRRSFFRALTPWVLDNPLMLHIRSNDDAEIRTAIDQAAECGFEMAIMSFGSGLNMEDISSASIARFKALREYATARGVRFGGYSLLASRRIDDENDVINPKTGKTGGAIFGNSPCLASKWGIEYFRRLKTFIEQTGFEMLEHDGNYPGDVCASTSHPGHVGLADSQWRQFEMITEFYEWCRERGVYLNVPDNYFFNGSNKSAMGYRETNWSLPRTQQHVHARQNIYDGTWDKVPSMGWMFVPLVEYQGGGAAATIEPLREHLLDYELHLANTFSSGVQATWRGTRLYDSPETKALVVRMVGWYKKYRDILESDVVHLRRPDGRRLDFVYHVNETTKPRAILSVFNPTGGDLREVVELPLGSVASGSITVREGEGKPKAYRAQNGVLKLPVSAKANGWTYYVLDRA